MALTERFHKLVRGESSCVAQPSAGSPHPVIQEARVEIDRIAGDRRAQALAVPEMAFAWALFDLRGVRLLEFMSPRGIAGDRCWPTGYLDKDYSQCAAYLYAIEDAFVLYDSNEEPLSNLYLADDINLAFDTAGLALRIETAWTAVH